MMMGNDLDDVVGEFPFFRQGLSGFAVRESHNGNFRLMQRNLFPAGALHGRGKLLGKNHAVHHEPDVMQQPRHISLLPIPVASFSLNFRHTMAHPSECLQKCLRIQRPFFRRESLPEATSKKDGFDAAQAQAYDGSLNGLRRLRQSEQRGTGHAQTLRGYGVVIRHQASPPRPLLRPPAELLNISAEAEKPPEWRAWSRYAARAHEWCQ